MNKITCVECGVEGDVVKAQSAGCSDYICCEINRLPRLPERTQAEAEDGQGWVARMFEGVAA